jgi:Amt family ammonium transporter
MISLCSGIIIGLVATTPSSGFIPLWAALILGVVSGTACKYGTKSKLNLRSQMTIILTLVLSQEFP